MTTIHIQIPDSKLNFLLEVLNNFSFVESVKTENNTIQYSLEHPTLSPAQVKEAYRRLEEYKKNPSIATDVDDFIKELEQEDENL